NNIYSWKPLRKEIYPAIVYQWFEWPIKTSMEFPSSSRANNNPTNTNINQQIIKNTNDDEITVNRCIIITINNDMLYEEISNDDNELNKALSLNNNESLYEAISDDDNEPNSALPPSDNELCVSNHDMVDDVSDYNNNNNNNL
ncbi:unnamed protein product, partial [Rotaria sordida]